MHTLEENAANCSVQHIFCNSLCERSVKIVFLKKNIFSQYKIWKIYELKKWSGKNQKKEKKKRFFYGEWSRCISFEMRVKISQNNLHSDKIHRFTTTTTTKNRLFAFIQARSFWVFGANYQNEEILLSKIIAFSSKSIFCSGNQQFQLTIGLQQFGFGKRKDFVWKCYRLNLNEIYLVEESCLFTN